jgi:hypothetical protein
MGKVDVKKSNI